ncbi:MAG TPA: hypothetical protein VGD62_13585 [Acidobacteriaceae bacterium]
MIADWTVEVSALSPWIDVPWEGWVDLCGARGAPDCAWHEERARALSEVEAYPELLRILECANGADTFTSKVDVFPVGASEVDPEISEAGEAGSRCGLGSYVDLVAARGDLFCTFARCEALARSTARALGAIECPGSCVEIVLRPARVFGREGFGWTIYTMGFGPDEVSARVTWARAAQVAVEVFLKEESFMIHRDVDERFAKVRDAVEVPGICEGE